MRELITSFIYDTNTGELLFIRGWGKHDIVLSEGTCFIDGRRGTGVNLNGHSTNEVVSVFLGGKRYSVKWLDDESFEIEWKPRAQGEQEYAVLGETADYVPPTPEERAEELRIYEEESGNSDIAFLCVRSSIQYSLKEWCVDLNTGELTRKSATII